jgi:hypothetical protein
MEKRDARPLRPMLWLAWLTTLHLATGCHRAAEVWWPAVSETGWRIQEGQALWRPTARAPELAGELLVARQEDGRALIQFSKTPFPLVLAQTTATNWAIRFPSQKLAFRGRRPPPARFAWLYLRPALAGEVLPAALRFERKPDGGWRLENRRTGETMEGYLDER